MNALSKTLLGGIPPQARDVWVRFAERLSAVAAFLLDGDLAKVNPDDRERMMEWQESRTRSALLHMLQLLGLLAAVKVTLVLAGVWPVAASPQVYAGALVVMGVALAVAHLVHTLVVDAISASTLRGGVAGGTAQCARQ